MSGKAAFAAAVIANALLGFGDMFSAASVWTVADVLQGERCFGEASVNCCTTCLGFTAVEYGVFSLPDWFTVPFIFFTSFFMDYFGFGKFGIAVGLIGVVGSALRVVGSMLGNVHALSYSLMLVGQIMIMGAMPMCVAVRNYTVHHFFKGKWRSLAVGLGFSFSMLAGFLAFMGARPFADAFGLTEMLVLSTGLYLMTPLCVAVLYVIDRIEKKTDYETIPETFESESDASTTIKKDLNDNVQLIMKKSLYIGERSVNTMSKKSSTPRKLLNWKAFGELESRFWLCLLALSPLKICTLSLAGIAIEFQKSNFGVSGEVAAFNYSMHYIAKVVSAPIVGFLMSIVRVHGPVSIMGYLVSLLGFTFLNLVSIDPLIAMILIGCGHVGVYSSLWSAISEFVSPQTLGLACSLNMFVICIGISFMSTTSGLLQQYISDHVHAWNVNMRIMFFTVLAGLVMCVLLNIVDFRHRNSGLYKKESEKSEKEAVDDPRQPLLRSRNASLSF